MVTDDLWKWRLASSARFTGQACNETRFPRFCKREFRLISPGSWSIVASLVLLITTESFSRIGTLCWGGCVEKLAIGALNAQSLRPDQSFTAPHAGALQGFVIRSEAAEVFQLPFTLTIDNTEAIRKLFTAGLDFMIQWMNTSIHRAVEVNCKLCRTRTPYSSQC